MTASAVYEGWVRHRRHDPIDHEFRYPLFMAYLDLAELPWVLDGVAGFSARRPAPARFRRADYIGSAEQPLAEAVREAVVERGGPEPKGPIRLLTNLRYFGHGFNPVSFYYCWDEEDSRVVSVLAEVTNTPWGERHSYLLGSPPEGSDSRVTRGEIDKAFHVSPLMGMDHTYDWRSTEPGKEVLVHIDSHSDAGSKGSANDTRSSRGQGPSNKTFDATLSMKRRPLDTPHATRLLLRYPAMTAQVVARIYWQSLKLKLKGAPYFPHPERG